MAYARETTVAPEKSQAEIKRILKAAGADPIGIMDSVETAFVQFEMADRRIQFRLRFPTADDLKFTQTGIRRTSAQRRTALDRETRRLWRCLLLTIKAKLVSIEDGIETFDEAFLAHVVMPGGLTIGERIVPEINQALTSDKLPPLLPAPRR